MDLIGLAQLLLLGLLVGWAALTLYTIHMLTHPPRRSYAWAVARSLPGTPEELRLPGRAADHRVRFREWTFRSGGLELGAWEISGDAPTGPVIVLTHGWADSRVTMLASGRVEPLLPQASRLILWDLPGHGDAPGTCSLGERESRHLAALVAHLGVPPGSLVLYGFSLGAIVTLKSLQHLEPDRRPAALILEAPYLAPWIPARNVLHLRGLPHRSNLPPALLWLGLRFGRGLSWRPRVTLPRGWLPEPPATMSTLILHGDADQITPLDGARQLARTLTAATLEVLPRGQHSTLFSDPVTRGLAAHATAAFIARVHAGAGSSADPASNAPITR